MADMDKRQQAMGGTRLGVCPDSWSAAVSQTSRSNAYQTKTYPLVRDRLNNILRDPFRQKIVIRKNEPNRQP